MRTGTGVKKWNGEELVQKVFGLDKRIKFCAIVDPDGKVKIGGMRAGTKALEPSDQTSLIVLRMAIGGKAIEASNVQLSKAKFGIVCRERVIQLVFSLPQREQLQVAADASFPIERVKAIEQTLIRLISRRYYD
jgi:hypothetical protein